MALVVVDLQPYVNIERFSQFIDGTPPIVVYAGIKQSSNWDGIDGNAGWRLDPDSAYFHNVVVRGVLSAVGFQRNTVHAAGGSLWVTPTTALTRNISASDSTIYVRDYTLEPNDVLIASVDFENIEYMRVLSEHYVLRDIDARTLTGEYTYKVARGICLTNPADHYIGDVIAVYCRGHDPEDPAKPAGMIAIEADKPYSPYIDILQRVGDFCTNVRTRVRIGNLDGIYDPLMNPGGYGFYGDNVYIKGVLKITADGTAIIMPWGWQDTTTSIIHGFVLEPRSVDCTHLACDICEYVKEKCDPPDLLNALNICDYIDQTCSISAGISAYAPEYPGAILVGDEGNNVGTMVTGWDDAAFHSFYEWQGGLSSPQYYNIIIRAQFPGAWDDRVTEALKIWTQTSNNSTSDNGVRIKIYDTANNLWADSGWVANSAWTQRTLNQAAGGTWAEGAWFTVIIGVASRSVRWARVAEMEFSF